MSSHFATVGLSVRQSVMVSSSFQDRWPYFLNV